MDAASSKEEFKEKYPNMYTVLGIFFEDSCIAYKWFPHKLPYELRLPEHEIWGKFTLVTDMDALEEKAASLSSEKTKLYVGIGRSYDSEHQLIAAGEGGDIQEFVESKPQAADICRLLDEIFDGPLNSLFTTGKSEE